MIEARTTVLKYGWTKGSNLTAAAWVGTSQTPGPQQAARLLHTAFFPLGHGQDSTGMRSITYYLSGEVRGFLYGQLKAGWGQPWGRSCGSATTGENQYTCLNITRSCALDSFCVAL